MHGRRQPREGGLVRGGGRVGSAIRASRWRADPAPPCRAVADYTRERVFAFGPFVTLETAHSLVPFLELPDTWSVVPRFAVAPLNARTGCTLHRLADPSPDRAIYVTSKRAASSAAGLELLRAGLRATEHEFDVRLSGQLCTAKGFFAAALTACLGLIPIRLKRACCWGRVPHDGVCFGLEGFGCGPDSQHDGDQADGRCQEEIPAGSEVVVRARHQPGCQVGADPPNAV